MDRLDAEAAAAGVENAGKKGAGAFLRFRPMILAQSHQVHGERGAVHLHPCSQAVMDAFRHFRGARFREGETEDIFRADVRPKQQAKDAGGEHMGLSRASRSEEHTSELQSLMRISYAVF